MDSSAAHIRISEQNGGYGVCPMECAPSTRNDKSSISKPTKQDSLGRRVSKSVGDLFLFERLGAGGFCEWVSSNNNYISNLFIFNVFVYYFIFYYHVGRNIFDKN